MKCSEIPVNILIEGVNEFDGTYITNNKIESPSYSYYKADEFKDQWNTHFTVWPTNKDYDNGENKGNGNGEFYKLHISLDFFGQGRNGKIFYVNKDCTGTDVQNLLDAEKQAFEQFVEDHQAEFDEMAIQFWTHAE